MARPIFAIIAIYLIIFTSILSQGVYGQAPDSDSQGKAIPDWVKTQFEWFVDGQIDEATLLTSMNWMFDNNLMHLSEEAAHEVNQLREVSTRLHQGVSTLIQKGQISEDEFEVLTGVDVEPVPAIAIPNLLDARKSGNESSASSGDFVSVAVGDINNLTTEEALNHLRKAYDLNPNDLTVIAEYDPVREEWTAMQAFEWHTEPTPNGEILSPTAIQKRTFVFSHLLENATAASLDETTTITYTGLEFASSTVDDIMTKGGTTSAWEDGIAAFPKPETVDSVVDELQGIVVLCSTEIDKHSQAIDAELMIIEQWLTIIEEQYEDSTAAGAATGETSTSQYNQSDLEFIRSKLASIDLKINGLSNGAEVLSQKVQAMDDSGTSSGEMVLKGKKILQNLVDEQQQKLDDMSERSKRSHDTAMSIIRKIG